MKSIVINEIIDLLKQTNEENVSFVYNQFVVTRDSSKVDVMGVYLNEDGNVEVECIPYSNWSLKYYDINSFAYKSLQKIRNEISKKVEE